MENFDIEFAKYEFVLNTEEPTYTIKDDKLYILKVEGFKTVLELAQDQSDLDIVREFMHQTGALWCSLAPCIDEDMVLK